MKLMTFAAIAAIAVVCAAPSAAAQNKAAANFVDDGCGAAVYPVRALNNRQNGLVEAGFLVGPDGAVEDSFIVTSSGVPDLDRATLETYRKCRFTPSTLNGQPVARWQPLLQSWLINSYPADPAFLKKMESGTPAGQYLLALMYRQGFMVAKDEAAAQRWLQVAAERGVPMAQFRMGEAYERGDGVAQDDEQAAVWYRKAAAQRNTFARERLHFGFGSIAPVPEKES